MSVNFLKCPTTIGVCSRCGKRADCVNIQGGNSGYALVCVEHLHKQMPSIKVRSASYRQHRRCRRPVRNLSRFT